MLATPRRRHSFRWCGGGVAAARKNALCESGTTTPCKVARDCTNVYGAWMHCEERIVPDKFHTKLYIPYIYVYGFVCRTIALRINPIIVCAYIILVIGYNNNISRALRDDMVCADQCNVHQRHNTRCAQNRRNVTIFINTHCAFCGLYYGYWYELRFA